MTPTNQATVCDEVILVCKAVQGDLDSFNQLVLLYQDLVYHHAQSLLDDHIAAEDVTQESFIKAFRKIKQMRGGSFRSWMLVIVTNTAYDFLRKSRRHPTISLYHEDDSGNELDSPTWLVDPNPSVETMIEQDELAKYIDRILEELPKVYRNVVTLIDRYDFDYAEAANALGIPVGTVRSRLARARYRLRNKMQNHPAQEGKPHMFNPVVAA